MNLKLKAHAQIILNKNPDFYLKDLRDNTRTTYGTGKSYDFEDRVDIVNRSFEIGQLFDYGNRNMIRPVIFGKVVENEDVYKLVLDFKIEGFLKTILGLGLIIGLIMPPIAYFFIEIEELKWVFTLAPLAIVIIYLQALAMFHYKVKSCLAKLEILN